MKLKWSRIRFYLKNMLPLYKQQSTMGRERRGRIDQSRKKAKNYQG